MSTSAISYVKGDATQPIGNGNKIIVLVCNDVGGWGKGFVTAISKRWPEPEKAYRSWYKTQLANKIGKDHPAINKLENGKVSAGYIFLLEVAAGLEVHIKDMIPDSAGSSK